MVTVAAAAGAFQSHDRADGPAGVPADAVHVPTALAPKATSSPTPTRLRVSAAPDGALFIVRLAIAGAEVVAGEAGETGDVGAAGAGAAGCVGGAGCAGAVSAALWPTGPSRSSASSAVEPVRRGAIDMSANDHGAAGDALVGTRLESGFCAVFRTAPRTVSFCCAEARVARANVAMTFSPGRPP